MSGPYSTFFYDETHGTLTPVELVSGAEDVLVNLNVVPRLLGLLKESKLLPSASVLARYLLGGEDESRARDALIGADPTGTNMPPAYAALRLLALYHRKTVEDADTLSVIGARVRIDFMFIAVGCLHITSEQIYYELSCYAKSCIPESPAALPVNA
jgi:hypothetical protein